MSLFKPAANTQAYIKAGFMGFAGSGKTFTAASLAIGLHGYLAEREQPEGQNPVLFLDTETGSDWVRDRFAEHGIPLMVAKTRAFVDLLAALKEARDGKSIMLTDSISHFWRELTESYAKKRNRTRGLEFQDWAYLKGEWAKFTDLYVNSPAHMLLCGRAGYEYDFFENDAGKKELQKTGIKMKAESETGYEPSLLVLMESEMDMESKRIYRTANVLKDRADVLDGQSFTNPTFETFLPHIEKLNIGGAHESFDATRNSMDSIPGHERNDWKFRETQREIVLEKVKNLFVEQGLDGTAAETKKKRLEALKTHFGTNAWSEIETMELGTLRDNFDRLHLTLTGHPSEYAPPPALVPDATEDVTY